jgi:hypothetical protein
MVGRRGIFVFAVAAGLMVWAGFEAWGGVGAMGGISLAGRDGVGDATGGAAANGQAAGAAAGAGTAIDLKAGLWDVVLHISTLLPETNVDTPELEKQLAKLSPEERAKTIAGLKKGEANTREVMKKGTDSKTKMCFTAKQFESGNLFQDLQNGSDCVKKMTSTSGKVSIHVSCAGPGGTATTWVADQTMEIQRVDAENFTATERTMQAGDPKVGSVHTLTAKWVRETCANEPSAAQKAEAKMEAEAPIAVRVDRIGNNYRTVVTNRSKTPLAAYSIGMAGVGGANGLLRVYDARMTGNAPTGPGGTIPEGQQGIIAAAKPVAAIFTDGTTFGNEKEVTLLMDRRRTELKALRAILPVLCNAAAKGEDGSTLASTTAGTLESARKSASTKGNDMQNSITFNAYTVVINVLRVSKKGHPATVEHAIQFVQGAARPLAADPVKDAGGKLYITAAETELKCGAGK